MLIRPARHDDAAAIWSILKPIVRAGDTYALDPQMSEADALTYWLGPEKETFVVDAEGSIVGTYYMRPNQAGGGSHVCNCGYITSPNATGRGIGRLMAQHSKSSIVLALGAGSPHWTISATLHAANADVIY